MPSAVKSEEYDLLRFSERRPKICTEKLGRVAPKPVYEKVKRIFDLCFSLLLVFP